MRREHLQELTPPELTRVDVVVEANWLSPMNAEIGIGAESAIKVILIYAIWFSEIHMYECFMLLTLN